MTSGKERASAAAATTTEARETVYQASNMIPRSHRITNRERGQGVILDFIPEGAGNALTASELAGVMGTDRRKVTKSIQRERLNGAPICASCGYPRGYWLAETPEELRDFIQRMEKRAGEMHTTISALMKTAEIWEEAGSWTSEKE